MERRREGEQEREREGGGEREGGKKGGRRRKGLKAAWGSGRLQVHKGSEVSEKEEEQSGTWGEKGTWATRIRSFRKDGEVGQCWSDSAEQLRFCGLRRSCGVWGKVTFRTV